jgi:acetyl-CoA acetyltransferase
MRSEPTMFVERDAMNPQASKDRAAGVFGQAGVTNPCEQIDCIEMYVPFSWYEPMCLENLGFAPEGDGWKMTEKGATALDGELPVNMSGGVLSTNPIGASGMLRFADAAMQVRGRAVATRSTALTWRSVTACAAARGSSPCGSSARSCSSTFLGVSGATPFTTGFASLGTLASSIRSLFVLA